ncbi:hypothetical protein HZF05_13680 [Sphingomonas sp. CGMCC 1.13654]|uniref:Uncharacterized protein n=1 Tax=Sphingomonas chungangi TaxID=2683589 RepID=A0A838L7Y6_9SPHN|nr:hypothetical protein [Sphingomonas chungangi]MBA2935137.1 hypothetical protein [Sphingomonas chungangi]MVW56083.1 hypothetical protein [Sphingomonas chungangi]
MDIAWLAAVYTTIASFDPNAVPIASTVVGDPAPQIYRCDLEQTVSIPANPDAQKSVAKMTRIYAFGRTKVSGFDDWSSWRWAAGMVYSRASFTAGRIDTENAYIDTAPVANADGSPLTQKYWYSRKQSIDKTTGSYTYEASGIPLKSGVPLASTANDQVAPLPMEDAIDTEEYRYLVQRTGHCERVQDPLAERTDHVRPNLASIIAYERSAGAQNLHLDAASSTVMLALPKRGQNWGSLSLVVAQTECSPGHYCGDQIELRLWDFLSNQLSDTTMATLRKNYPDVRFSIDGFGLRASTMLNVGDAGIPAADFKAAQDKLSAIYLNPKVASLINNDHSARANLTPAVLATRVTADVESMTKALTALGYGETAQFSDSGWVLVVPSFHTAVGLQKVTIQLHPCGDPTRCGTLLEFQEQIDRGDKGKVLNWLASHREVTLAPDPDDSDEYDLNYVVDLKSGKSLRELLADLKAWWSIDASIADIVKGKSS